MQNAAESKQREPLHSICAAAIRQAGGGPPVGWLHLHRIPAVAMDYILSS